MHATLYQASRRIPVLVTSLFRGELTKGWMDTPKDMVTEAEAMFAVVKADAYAEIVATKAKVAIAQSKVELAKAEAAVAVFGPERVFLNPDCGFATFADNPLASAEVAERKMEVIALAARALRAKY